MLSCCSQSLVLRNSMTRGEHPTVFSLKSRRSFPARPPLGGEYGAMRRTAFLGLRLKANLHGASVGFESFGPGERGDGGGEFREGAGVELLDRDHLHEVGCGQASTETCDATGGQNVVGTCCIVSGGFRAIRSEENATRVANLWNQFGVM